MIVIERDGLLDEQAGGQATSPQETMRFIPISYEFAGRAVPFVPGQQAPFRGHWLSPVFFPNPHAFIMPRWQIEKSNLIGSTGSMARSEAVMSAAIRHPGLFSVVSLRHWPTRMMCVSSGTINWPALTFFHAPRST